MKIAKSTHKPQKDRLTISIDRHHLKAVKHEAAAVNTSLANIIRTAVATYVEGI